MRISLDSFLIGLVLVLAIWVWIMPHEVHYLLPHNKEADVKCSVKMMFFRDSDGNVLNGEVRKVCDYGDGIVCHWKNSY